MEFRNGHNSVLLLHGSKVSRESDLPSVPYDRHGVRLFVKNVKSLSENQHNS